MEDIGMTKTISLRLSQREEQSILLLRKQGVSPSMLMRKALSNILQEKEEKEYKDVDSVNIILQENVNTEDRKVYNGENIVNTNVNRHTDSFREKAVYTHVNMQNPALAVFLEQYLQHLENELQDWKQRYSLEVQYWKEAYQSLQIEYQNQMKDSMKRIDDKFYRIMFYMEEIRKSPLHPVEISSSGDQQDKPKRWTSQMIRM
jgi:hypothetical protein